MREDSRFEVVPLSEVPVSKEQGKLKSVVTPSPVVLVVDDEEIIADTRSAILTGWGYTVVTAYSAETALEMARKDPPRYFVSDVQLSRMNGVDLAFAIRTLATDCRVVLFSGDTDSLPAGDTAKNSMHDFTFLQKPIHPVQLSPIFPVIDERA